MQTHRAACRYTSSLASNAANLATRLRKTEEGDGEEEVVSGEIFFLFFFLSSSVVQASTRFAFVALFFVQS